MSGAIWPARQPRTHSGVHATNASSFTGLVGFTQAVIDWRSCALLHDLTDEVEYASTRCKLEHRSRGVIDTIIQEPLVSILAGPNPGACLTAMPGSVRRPLLQFSPGSKADGQAGAATRPQEAQIRSASGREGVLIFNRPHHSTSRFADFRLRCRESRVWRFAAP